MRATLALLSAGGLAARAGAADVVNYIDVGTATFQLGDDAASHSYVKVTSDVAGVTALNATVQTSLEPANAAGRCADLGGSAGWTCSVPLYCLRGDTVTCDTVDIGDGTLGLSATDLVNSIAWYQTALHLKLEGTEATLHPHEDTATDWPAVFKDFNAVWSDDKSSPNSWVVNATRSLVDPASLYRLGPTLYRAHPAALHSHPWYIIGNGDWSAADVVVCERTTEGRDAFSCHNLPKRDRATRAGFALDLSVATFEPSLETLSSAFEPQPVTRVSIAVDSSAITFPSATALPSFVAYRLASLADAAQYTRAMHVAHVNRHEDSSFWVRTMYTAALTTTVLLCINAAAWVVWLLTWRWPQVIIPMGRTNVTVLGFLLTFAVTLQVRFGAAGRVPFRRVWLLRRARFFFFPKKRTFLLSKKKRPVEFRSVAQRAPRPVLTPPAPLSPRPHRSAAGSSGFRGGSPSTVCSSRGMC
jgi:hypothetical protein